MFDPNQYRTDCARLTLGAEKLEEIITMTENTKKKPMSRPMKAALIAAACVAALTVTAMATPAMQQLFTTYTITFRSADSATAYTLPTLALEERDGRSILTVNDLETDVTDAFAKNGQYEMNVDGANIVVKPDGWVTVTMDTGEDTGPITYTFSLNAQDSDGLPTSIQVDDSEALTEVGFYSISTDENGAVVVVESEPLYLPE